MPLTLNGTTGVAGIDGSASTPSIQGTDTNTGVWFPAADTVAIATNGTERMRVDSNGDVGIGGLPLYTTPSTRGTVTINGSSSSVLTLSSAGSSSTASYFYYDGTNLIQNVVSSGYLSFGTNNTERARFDSSGNLIIGTNSAGATLTVYHGGNQKSADFYGAGNTSGTPVMSCRKGANDSTTSNVYIQFLYNNGGTGSGQINGNGGSQAAFGSYSDIRLKENVESLIPQLNKICALRPVEFDYIETGEHQIGFIAQEMQTVYPDAVATGENGMLTVTGWNKTEARLVSAIKELSAKVDALQIEINALKGAA